MFTRRFVNHIRRNNLRLLKMDGNIRRSATTRSTTICPASIRPKPSGTRLADITRDLDKACPELFIMLYWGCRSPWHLMYGDVSFDPGLALEAAHPEPRPAPYIRDSITVGLDQAQWFCDDTPKLGKDSLGVWLSRWGWNSGVGKRAVAGGVHHGHCPRQHAWPSPGRTTAASRSSSAANWPTSSRC